MPNPPTPVAAAPLTATPAKAAVMPADMLLQLKHASQEIDQTTESFLFIGRKSSGKKTLALTIPGKKLIFCFDHNASSGLAGMKDVDYIEFLPRKLKGAMKPTPPGDAAVRKSFNPVANPPGPFGDFEKFLRKAQETDFFQQYDVIGLISCTSLQDIMLDHTIAMLGRPGYVPERNDRNLVGQGMANIFRSILSEDVMVFATAHYSYNQDDETKRMMNLPVLIGQQKSKIPNIFSNVWMCSVEYDGKSEDGVKYFIQTVEDKQTFNLGRSRRLASLPPRKDVTMKDPRNVTGQGIAAIFAQAGIKPKEREG